VIKRKPDALYEVSAELVVMLVARALAACRALGTSMMSEPPLILVILLM
jgi:hypothetical protein